MHTRLSTGVSNGNLALDYLKVLGDHIMTPLLKDGTEGVSRAVTNMAANNLMRQDLDGILEVNKWPDNLDPMTFVDSKTKAAFTRKCNNRGVAFPYMINMPVSKKRGRHWQEEITDENDDFDNQDMEENVENYKKFKF